MSSFKSDPFTLMLNLFYYGKAARIEYLYDFEKTENNENILKKEIWKTFTKEDFTRILSTSAKRDFLIRVVPIDLPEIGFPSMGEFEHKILNQYMVWRA